MIDMTSKSLVRSMADVPHAAVERHTYPGAHGALAFHLYRPAHDRPCPVVVLVNGYADPWAAAAFGRPMREWTSCAEWARLVAAAGMAAVLYENREPADVHALVAHLGAQAAALRLDGDRLGVLASSGHAPLALAVIAGAPIRAAALLYGYLLDLDGDTSVAAAARVLPFAAPPVALAALSGCAPLVVRAGRDTTPGLNGTIDRFVAARRARHEPLALVEHAEGPHAFDLLDDTPRSRAVIDEVVAFLRKVLVE